MPQPVLDPGIARALDSVRPPSAVARLLLAVVGLYRHRLSPLLPPACRFTPSCSAYATDALERHPLPRALSLTAWRLARCQPFSRGGHDPVPLPRTQA